MGEKQTRAELEKEALSYKMSLTKTGKVNISEYVSGEDMIRQIQHECFLLKINPSDVVIYNDSDGYSDERYLYLHYPTTKTDKELIQEIENCKRTKEWRHQQYLEMKNEFENKET